MFKWEEVEHHGKKFLRRGTQQGLAIVSQSPRHGRWLYRVTPKEPEFNDFVAGHKLSMRAAVRAASEALDRYV